MSTTLYAGAARRLINPPVGTRRPGIRLFADPIQAIESDLTATVLVLSNGVGRVAIVACDLCGVPKTVVSDLRNRIAAAIGTSVAQVLFNESHTHSGPAFPDFIPDTPEQMALKRRYQEDMTRRVVAAAVEADQKLQPARIGAGWGECRIGAYRRETGPDGRDVLGEVPDHPIDPAVGVIRVDDLDGNAIATLFSYGCHPVTMGPRSLLASSDYPGRAREIVENALGGLAIFLQACGGNINPIGGIGYEIDCRDNKNRVGAILGGEVVKVAANVRTHVRPGERTPMDTIPNILFSPWVPATGDTCTCLGAVAETLPLELVDLPPLAEAEAICDQWQRTLAEAEAGGARDWEVRVAIRFAHWSEKLVEAVRAGHPTLDMVIQAIRINDIALVGIGAEVFFETGLSIKRQSPIPHTQVLGYSNGCVSYLPRVEDYPAGGWNIHERYAVPDLFFQSYSVPAALHPDSEALVRERTLELIRQLQ